MCLCVRTWLGSTCVSPAWHGNLHSDTTKNTPAIRDGSRLQRACNNLRYFLSCCTLSRPHTVLRQQRLFFSLLIREGSNKNVNLAKRGRESECVLCSGWKFTCHWFPLSPARSLTRSLSAVLKRQKTSPSGISSNPSATGSERPEAARHLNLQVGASTIQSSVQTEVGHSGQQQETLTHKNMPRRRFNSDGYSCDLTWG